MLYTKSFNAAIINSSPYFLAINHIIFFQQPILSFFLRCLLLSYFMVIYPSKFSHFLTLPQACLWLKLAQTCLTSDQVKEAWWVRFIITTEHKEKLHLGKGAENIHVQFIK